MLCNHAAVQGQHLNNTVMYTPIYAGPGARTLIGFFAINVHWIDIGGVVPHSTDIFMEGLQLRSIKLWKQGEPVEEIYRIIENNTRQPVELMGDIAAQLAGCLLGRDLMADLVDKYGVATFERAVEHHPRPVGGRRPRADPLDARRRLYARDLPRQRPRRRRAAADPHQGHRRWRRNDDRLFRTSPTR